MFRPVVVIPYYNHPATIAAMAEAVLAHGLPLILVDDGSDAVGAGAADAVAARHSQALALLRLPANQGKGGAVMAGLRLAAQQGYSHALQIDADGQHDPADIPLLLAQAQTQPEAMVCGVPVYDESVPKGRLYGRYLTHVWVWINTLSLDVRDSMCGFRVYPLPATLAVLNGARLGRRMDFDSEVLVRLHWRGVPFVSVPTHVRYPQDGVSHFRLAMDNVHISWMHARLFAGMLVRLPLLLWRTVARSWRRHA